MTDTADMRSDPCKALDHPRRCWLCAIRLYECMSFVLARDILIIWEREVIHKDLPLPRIKVRELCSRCVRKWNEISESWYL